MTRAALALPALLALPASTGFDCKIDRQSGEGACVAIGGQGRFPFL